MFKNVTIIMLSLMMLFGMFGYNYVEAFDETITYPYDYPVKGGTEEWKAFTSLDEMLEACQIPESILKKMSTAGLVETVLNYPLLGNIYAYNSLQQGFEAVTAQFNGLEELLKRKDAGVELLARYRAMNPLAIEEDWDDIQKGAYAVSLSYIEILLSQDNVLADLTGPQIEELLREAIKTYRAKQQLVDVYYTGLECTVWLMGKTLQQRLLNNKYGRIQLSKAF